jgi:hypothetical protein
MVPRVSNCGFILCLHSLITIILLSPLKLQLYCTGNFEMVRRDPPSLLPLVDICHVLLPQQNLHQLIIYFSQASSKKLDLLRNGEQHLYNPAEIHAATKHEANIWPHPVAIHNNLRPCKSRQMSVLW